MISSPDLLISSDGDPYSVLKGWEFRIGVLLQRCSSGVVPFVSNIQIHLVMAATPATLATQSAPSGCTVKPFSDITNHDHEKHKIEVNFENFKILDNVSSKFSLWRHYTKTALSKHWYARPMYPRNLILFSSFFFVRVTHAFHVSILWGLRVL